MASQDRDFNKFNNTPTRPIRDFESVIELTYQAQLAPWWTLQPDIQYIIHPGGNAPDPTSPGAVGTLQNALQVGMRTTAKF